MVRGTARAITLAALLLFMGAAYATEKHPPKPPPKAEMSQLQKQQQLQDQYQKQLQEQKAYGGDGGHGGDGGSVGDVDSSSVSDSQSQAMATNEGVDVDASDNSTTTTENNSSNVVLVPNNNTESCIRVWGIAWGKDGQSGALGWPWRSKQCDFGQAASAADAQGNHELGWYWRCHQKSLFKTFKGKGETREAAVEQCHEKMIGSVGMVNTIRMLKDQNAELNELRQIERSSYTKLTENLTEQCEESKGRIAEACRK